MKGVELPVNALVIITIAVIFLIVALVFLGGLPSIGQQQTRQGFLSGCCTAYNLEGKCGQLEDTFKCSVSNDYDPDGTVDGKLSIKDLSDAVGITEYETYCRCVAG